MLAATTCLPKRVHAQTWTNGQPASYVIGQTGFNLNGSGTTPTSLALPESAIVDPASGKVFVCDVFNSRVLRYPSTAAMTNGAAAEAVLGQSGFFSSGYSQPPTAASLTYPTGIAIDGSGSLWVADGDNSRVLRYDNAATIASGSPANGVLGQPDFVSNTAANPPTGASFHLPNSVFCSGTTLWVSDGDNNRILRFDDAASKANGANADAVFGQPNFVTGNYGATNTAANLLALPCQIYVDGSDNLWVADANNNRVLMFPNASFAVNGTNGGVGGPATLVLGQTGFTDNPSDITASAMDYPYGVYGDAAGNIYVGDVVNNRILVFANAAGLSNGAAASYVLGEPGLSIYPNPAQSSMVVKVPQKGTAEIDIHSSAGMLMQRLVTGAAVNNIDISWFAAGMYMVTVVQGGSTVSGSFMKAN